MGEHQMPGGAGPPGYGQGDKPAAIRLGTDITKRKEELDPSKLAAKQRYQEEIKQ